MSDTITIKFRAKLDNFAGGKGYKIPTLKTHHLVTTRSQMTSYQDMALNCGTSAEFFARRLATAMRKAGLGGVVWTESIFDQDPITADINIKPIGKGFMADVTITFPFNKAALSRQAA